MIVATLPIWQEPDILVAQATASCVHVGVRVIRYPGGIVGAGGGRYDSEAAMRRHGLRLARAAGASWWLQLDADEQLVNGDQLPALLAGWPRIGGDHPHAYPLPYRQENGDLTLAPFKLVDARAELAAHSDYFYAGAGTPVYCLSGFTLPAELAAVALAGPFLDHRPSLRRNGGHRRLSLDELSLEPRPLNALPFPIERYPTVKGVPMAAGGKTLDPDKTEYQASDGDYYCPGCGQRYDTAGVCAGTDEGPHEPIQVEKVKPAAKTETAGDGKGGKGGK